VPPSGTTCLSTSHLRRHSRFSDNDSRPFCFPVPTKTLSYDSRVTITIHHYCLDICGSCNISHYLGHVKMFMLMMMTIKITDRLVKKNSSSLIGVTRSHFTQSMVIFEQQFHRQQVPVLSSGHHDVSCVHAAVEARQSLVCAGPCYQ